MSGLSVVLPGGGMKLSYQTGRLAALLDADVVPHQWLAVSSGIVGIPRC
jgi:predicted patatin/cPLA2 family phospholipase